MRPKYTFTKRQVNNVKGRQVNYKDDGAWPLVLGFFKTMKEAREAVESHKLDINSRAKN